MYSLFRMETQRNKEELKMKEKTQRASTSHRRSLDVTPSKPRRHTVEMYASAARYPSRRYLLASHLVTFLVFLHFKLIRVFISLVWLIAAA